MRYKIVLCSIAACMATVLTGCASTLHPFGDDHLTITGTPKGFDSFFDGLDTIEQSAKADPHQATNAARHQHDKQLTERHGLTMRFGASNATTGGTIHE